jgi:hypothetical protein
LSLVELRERMVGIASLFAAKASGVNALGRMWRRRLRYDLRGEEQDMPYLSRDRRRAEGGEGDVNDGFDDEHVDGRVRGPHLADTGNGQRRRLRHDGDNDDDVEEGGSHPTTSQTTAMRELAERLRSTGRDWQRAEEGEGDINNGGNN